MFGKLIGLLSIGSSVANVALVRRFLEGIVGAIALTILSAIMAGALLVGGLYGLYMGLTRHGLDPDAALITMGAISVLLTATLVGLALTRLRQLH